MRKPSPRILPPLLSIIVASGACTLTGPPGPAVKDADPLDMNRIAEAYVRLVLAVGEHDEAYVDAYYGPPEWREEVRKNVPGLEAIRSGAASLIEELRGNPVTEAHPRREEPTGEDGAGGGDAAMEALRHRYLLKQLEALHAYAGMRLGEKHSFDEEARLLYDADPPHHDAGHFEEIIEQLGALLPGEGAVAERFERFRSDFVIPADRLDAVFQAAIEEARLRVGRHLSLPEGESFRIAYVTDKPWSGYNWYQGNGSSLIEINTDLPIYIDRAIDLACHEGYPGHHVYNALLEKNMVRDRGWWEFSVYPLFSPQSLIAEGSANYGIDMAFPREERIAFEKNVLFPLAGIDPRRADTFYEAHDLVSRLNYAGNEAARSYLDGAMDADAAAAWLAAHALMSEERARQRIRFMDTYRSYVINYNLGQDLVRRHVEELTSGDGAPTRWQVFEALLSSPRLPSGLAGGRRQSN